MLEAQNKRIDELMDRIRLQQEKLDKQNVRIRTLQSQVRKPRKQRANTRICIAHHHFQMLFQCSEISCFSNFASGATDTSEDVLAEQQR